MGGVTSNFNTNPDTDGTPLIVDPDGTVYNFGSPWGCGKDTSGSHQNYGLPTSIEDRNGNLVNIATTYGQNSTCVGSTAYISDALGRIITASTFGQTGSTVTVAGLSNPYTLTWVASAPGVGNLAPSTRHGFTLRCLGRKGGQSGSIRRDGDRSAERTKLHVRI